MMLHSAAFAGSRSIVLQVCKQLVQREVTTADDETYSFLGMLLAQGVLPASLVEPTVTTVLDIRRFAGKYNGDATGWRTLWECTVHHLTKLLTTAASSVDIGTARRITVRAKDAGISGPAMDNLVAALTGGNSGAAFREGWTVWGPKDLSHAGCPVGRCPICRKVCFYRTVLPATGWQRTLDHLAYTCCYDLFRSLGTGACPVRGCGFVALGKSKWQVVAHLDEASDAAHVQLLQSVAASSSGKARGTKAPKRNPQLALNAKKLYAAAKGNDHVAVAELLRAATTTTEVNSGGEDGYTPFMTAAEAGHVATVRALAADPRCQHNLQNVYGQTALILAAQNGRVGVLHTLLEGGGRAVDLTLRANGLTAEETAEVVGHTEAASVLRTYGTRATAAQTATRALHTMVHSVLDTLRNAHDASAHGAQMSAAILEALERVGADTPLDAPSPRNGDSLFLNAARAGLHRVVQALLTRSHCDINQVGSMGNTALQVAVEGGHAAVVRALCDHGGDVLDVGNTVQLARHHGHKHIAQMLAKHITNIRASAYRTHKRGTSDPGRLLHYAVRNDDVAAVTELIRTRSELLVCGWPWKQSLIPLHVAAHYDSTACAAVLAAATPPATTLFHTNASGRTALQEARTWGHTQTFHAIAHAVVGRTPDAAPVVPSTHETSKSNAGVDLEAMRVRLAQTARNLTDQIESSINVVQQQLGRSWDTPSHAVAARTQSAVPVRTSTTRAVSGCNGGAHGSADEGAPVEGAGAVPDAFPRRVRSAPWSCGQMQTSTPPPTTLVHDAATGDADVDDTNCNTDLAGTGVRKKPAGSQRERPLERTRRRHIDALLLEHPGHIQNKLQRDFLARHRRQASQQWMEYAERSSYGNPYIVPVSVEPLDLGAHPHDAFLARLRSLRRDHPRLAWHGTHVSNIPSVAQHGLVVPGGDGRNATWAGKPTVRVVNGQAHGKGVYVAKNPELAHGFARGNPHSELLLCAVLDDYRSRTATSARGRVGHLRVHGETSNVRHVGDAIVVGVVSSAPRHPRANPVATPKFPCAHAVLQRSHSLYAFPWYNHILYGKRLSVHAHTYTCTVSPRSTNTCRRMRHFAKHPCTNVTLPTGTPTLICVRCAWVAGTGEAGGPCVTAVQAVVWRPGGSAGESRDAAPQATAAGAQGREDAA
eukprot:m.37305 g.37305  ORF g.37305 m.37305 type:complete len:1163 (-) comp14544_c0_seq12:919-4407(-)